MNTLRELDRESEGEVDLDLDLDLAHGVHVQEHGHEHLAPPASLPLALLMAEGDRPGRRQDHAPAPAPAKLRVTDLSVVVPAKNEHQNLGALLDELTSVLRAQANLTFEILVIDDGSDDGTAALAEARGARVVRHAESLGNGAAVKRGIREARCGWILLLDGDGQHPPAAIPAMLALAERYDMVVGSRGGTGGAWHRNLANRAYNVLASYVANRPIPDLTSGFRLLRADLGQGFAYLLPNTFSYPTTLTLSFVRAGYSVGFAPFAVRQRGGKSHIRVLRDGARFFLIILRIATFYAPLRVFLPLSVAMALAGAAWYLVTYWSEGRLTNMTGLLLTQATVIFVLGLISEQIAAMRFERAEGKR